MVTIGETATLLDQVPFNPNLVPIILDALNDLDMARPYNETARCLWVDIINVLDKLEPMHRRTLLLYHYCGYDQRAIAKAEGISQQAVTKRLQTAHKRFATACTETAY